MIERMHGQNDSVQPLLLWLPMNRIAFLRSIYNPCGSHKLAIGPSYYDEHLNCKYAGSVSQQILSALIRRGRSLY